MTQTQIKFWGTRGSCPVSGEEFRKFGGNTPCVEIIHEKASVILDGGTGIRPLGEILAQQGPKELFLIISHMHWDHVMGIPFFEPLYREGVQLHVFAPEEEGHHLKRLFEELFTHEFFPIRLSEVKAQLHFHPVVAGDTLHFGSLKIHTYPTHHPGHALGFKLEIGGEKIGYITDNELFQGHQGEIETISEELLKKTRPLIHFLSDCTQLIHEAQYFPEEYEKKVGWGHSSVKNTIALLKELKISAWHVVHHDPKHTDKDLEKLEALAKALLKKNGIKISARWLCDGTVLNF